MSNPSNIRVVNGELWVEIVGNRGYWVNTKGDIIGRKGNVIKGGLSGKGYRQFKPYVGCTNGKEMNKCLRIHRVVAMTFLPNFYGKEQVNHKDGIKINNNVSNLEWVTNTENVKHKVENGLAARNFGSINGASNLDDEKVKDIYVSELKQQDLIKKYNVDQATISSIQNDRNWRHLTKYLTKPQKRKLYGGKLSEDDVLNIYHSSKTNGELSAIYNVSETQIRRIKTGERWSRVTNKIEE